MGLLGRTTQRTRRSRYAPKPFLFRLFILGIKVYGVLVLFHFVGFHTLLFPLTLSNESMTPSIGEGESVIVSRLSYTIKPLESLLNFRWQSPARGEIVVFPTPYQTPPSLSENTGAFLVRFFFFGWTPDFLRPETPFEKQGYQVRRVVGIPGDTLEYRLGEWYISSQESSTFASELLLSDREYRPRLPEVRSGVISPFGDSSYPFTLGEDEWFVAADNRAGALDSRYYGVISFKDIQGRVVLRYLPLSRVGIL